MEDNPMKDFNKNFDPEISREFIYSKGREDVFPNLAEMIDDLVERMEEESKELKRHNVETQVLPALSANKLEGNN
jgi:hypothetical protein